MDKTQSMKFVHVPTTWKEAPFNLTIFGPWEGVPITFKSYKHEWPLKWSTLYSSVYQERQSSGGAAVEAE